MEYNINNGYSTCYSSLQSQLPTPPGSDSAYSPENGTIPCSSSCYYSPDTGLDALTYTQCMQQATQSTEASVPVTTIHHHQRADQQPPPPPQVPHHTNLSPVHHHQVSPQQQVSPDSSTGNIITTTPNMTSNLTPPTQLNTFLMRMQQAGQCAEQHQRLLLQHEQETARRLSHIGNMYSTALPNLEISRMPKKRKMTTASPNHNIKTEPGKEYEIEDNTPETYRSLPWSDYDKDKWAVMLDTNGRLIGGFKYVVSADKGFVHSEAHAAFVSQKKNHFQVTVTAYGFGAPKFIRTENGLVEIRSFYITLFGFKNESKSQVIAINQSTVERQKYSLDPIRVEFHNGSLTKTIPRLHFSATTENNMRKKGKPNPNQRFFSLVVSLEAETVAGTKHCVAAAISDRIIVRASSPSNFDLEQQLWERVDNSSIRYMGNVGINIDRPEHATLAVGGNVVITGAINNYSDKRVKENITSADTTKELKAVKKLNLYKYNYTNEFCDYSNIETDEQMGVIAQEVQNIFPDAVHTTGEVNLPTSGKIDNLLTVNKDRIYMAGVGAVKELSGITDNILEKIDELEQVNTNLVDRFKRRFGSKSTLNSSIKSGFKNKEKTHIFGSMESLRSRMSIKKTLRMMQGAVCCLSAVVVLCLAAIICLFVVMHHNASIVSYHHGDSSSPDLTPHNNTDTGDTDGGHDGDTDGGKASPQQAVTVTKIPTYGPTLHPPTKEPASSFFQNVNCDIAKIQNIAPSHFKLQYMRSGKRLNCIYQINMTPDQYFLQTNGHYFRILISTTQDRIDMEQCQYKPTPCNGVFLNSNTTLSKSIASPAAKVQSKQRAHDREYEYLLLSGTSKIVTRVRLLPANAACSQCCHVNNGDYTDIRFTFNFKCPAETEYRVHPIT